MIGGSLLEVIINMKNEKRRGFNRTMIVWKGESLSGSKCVKSNFNRTMVVWKGACGCRKVTGHEVSIVLW